MNTEWQFAFGVDANYVKYAGIMMTSIVLNHPGQPVCFHLACDGLTEEDKAKLDQFTLLYRNTKIVIYDAVKILETLPLLPAVAPERLNRSVFLRILLPSFLPAELTKVAYLDADMLCIGDLADLWQIETGSQAVAASLDPGHEKNAKRLALTHTRYFNAGAMVINLPVWRQEKLTQQVLDSYRTMGSRFVLLEQDALNVTLDGRFQQLPERFNRQLTAFNPLLIKREPEDAILHFVNEGKPWIKGCVPEMEELYWSYVRRSLWFDLQPTEPWDVKTAYLAGKNAEGRGDYKEATHYLGIAAYRLLEFYLEQTSKN